MTAQEMEEAFLGVQIYASYEGKIQKAFRVTNAKYAMGGIYLEDGTKNWTSIGWVSRTYFLADMYANILLAEGQVRLEHDFLDEMIVVGIIGKGKHRELASIEQQKEECRNIMNDLIRDRERGKVSKGANRIFAKQIAKYWGDKVTDEELSYLAERLGFKKNVLLANYKDWIKLFTTPSEDPNTYSYFEAISRHWWWRRLQHLNEVYHDGLGQD